MGMSLLVADDVVQDSPIIYLFPSLFSRSSFPPLSLPYLIMGAKTRRKKGERELIRKQNGKENGGETVGNIKRGAYSKMGRGEN